MEMASLFVLSLLVLSVGITGFTKRGLRFSAKRRLYGRAGIAIGSACTVIACGTILLEYLFGTLAEQQMITLVLLGICLGAIGTWNAMRGSGKPAEN